MKIESTKTTMATIYDQNDKPRKGKIIVDYIDGIPMVAWLRYGSQMKSYRYSRDGTNNGTGERVIEMRYTDADRIWVSMDGSKVWED